MPKATWTAHIYETLSDGTKRYRGFIADQATAEAWIETQEGTFEISSDGPLHNSRTTEEVDNE